MHCCLGGVCPTRIRWCCCGGSGRSGRTGRTGRGGRSDGSVAAVVVAAAVVAAEAVAWPGGQRVVAELCRTQGRVLC